MVSRRPFAVLLAGFALALSLTGSPLVAQDDLADVIERCERGVVRIDVEGRKGGSLGSGFIVDDKGTLVTNVHVLAGAKNAIAHFPNGKAYAVVGTLAIDEGRDICVARIDSTETNIIPIAQDLPRKGERVTALGSPHGLSFTATTGIISAIRPADELGRDIGDPTMRGTWVQVDAALSPGNSGGPLINGKGEVVGMSTRASQGSAQNLNFGISGVDIQAAVSSSATAKLVSLADGVEKIETEDHMPESGAIIARPAVPEDSLKGYIAQGRDSFKDLTRGLSREISRTNTIYREAKKGESFIPAQIGAPPTAQIVRMRGRSSNDYFFRNETIKNREVDRLRSRVSQLEKLKDSVSDPNDNESLFSLLWNFGPRLDPRNVEKVGFMTDAIALHAFNDHDMVVQYEEAEFLLWVESTAGLSEGAELQATPVYVAGTETIEIPGLPPRSVTVLHSVTEKEMRAAIFGAGAETPAKLRKWKDSSGQFEVEAELLSTTATSVVLKKPDGSIVEVPFAKLCDEDLRFLGKK